MNDSPVIRRASHDDASAIDRVHRDAFPEIEGPAVAKLAMRLLSEPSTPETLAWVAARDEVTIGHIAFSPLSLGGSGRSGYLLSPLGVSPERQQGGVGAALVTCGLAELKSRSIDLVFVYGDPRYYTRFGFAADVAAPYEAPYALELPFGWLALALTDGAPFDGRVSTTCVPALRDPALW